MKNLLVILFTLVSASVSLADGGGDLGSSNTDLPTWVEQCRQIAIPKLEAQAASKGAILDVESVTVWSIDDRVWNPWKYVWVAARGQIAPNAYIHLQELTQKGPFQDCF